MHAGLDIFMDKKLYACSIRIGTYFIWKVGNYELVQISGDTLLDSRLPTICLYHCSIW